MINQVLNNGCAVPAAHRIVGIGEIDQFCAQEAGLLGKALRVLVIAQIWYHMQGAAIAGGMVVEGRIGPVGGENGIFRRNGQAGQGQ